MSATETPKEVVYCNPAELQILHVPPFVATVDTFTHGLSKYHLKRKAPLLSSNGFGLPLGLSVVSVCASAVWYPYLVRL
jgi:hypothetical protein